MNKFFTSWVEQYLFEPNILQRLIGILFFPITILNCIYTTYKRVGAKPINYGIPVISVGNLLVGGTGKTPITIALAKDKKDVAIVLRGYGRESKGLYIISKKGKIVEDVTVSGDEAMLLAKSLPNATVIVSEDRVKAILKAKELGCQVVYLDDGYGKHNIMKYDILVRPAIDPSNIFCLPSGGYRDTPMMYSFADIVLRDGEDFKRIVTFKKDGDVVESLPKDTILLTAISKPNRLLEFLPQNIKMVTYPDHYNFTSKDIENIKQKYPTNPIVVTAKDMVKLKQFNLADVYLMDLEVTIDDDCVAKIDGYLKR
ncbi:MAG: tetraacyldisaccharide 4'-kinase [Campylobacterota bacterium]|nr:tetraacyldisaccharide 4'-kinase [Campylobacterota bacterium]